MSHSIIFLCGVADVELQRTIKQNQIASFSIKNIFCCGFFLWDAGRSFPLSQEKEMKSCYSIFYLFYLFVSRLYCFLEITESGERIQDTFLILFSIQQQPCEASWVERE